VSQILRRRAELMNAVRRFFDARDYLEVETPVMVPSPGLDLHLEAFQVAGVTPPAFLTTSPEYQMKRLVAAGMPRIYQLSRAFRAGEQGRWHNREFTMLEWYRVEASATELMDETETLVRSMLELEEPFDRFTVAEAFATFADSADALDLADTDPDAFFRTLVDRVEPALATRPGGVFLYDYPISQASLARAKPSDPRVCERFELYVRGVELCNGFGELTDAAEHRRRFESAQRQRAAAGLPVYPIDQRFLEALDEGLPHCAGNALGVDRLVALALDADGIADAMAFPAHSL